MIPHRTFCMHSSFGAIGPSQSKSFLRSRRVWVRFRSLLVFLFDKLGFLSSCMYQ